MPNVLFFPYMAKTTENLPNRIREWRLRKNFTLVGLAKEMRTTHGQIQKMEVGERPVTLAWLDRFAAALDVSVGELLHPSQNPRLPNPRQAALLEMLERGGEQAMRTAEAVAEAARPYTPPMPEEGANDAA